MKKLTYLLITALFILVLTGCGSEKAKKKADEAFTEKLMEESLGTDVEVDGDTVEFEAEDGTKVSLGGSEWPTSNLIKNIPEFKSGTIISVADSETYSNILIEEVKENDFKDYLKLVKADFKENTFEMDSDGIYTYGANNEDGIGISVSFEEEERTLTISASKIE